MAAFFAKDIIASITGKYDSWPRTTASSIFSSLNWWASDSTIRTPFFVPATTRSNFESFISCIVGLTTNLSSTKPIFVAPKGPINGNPDKVTAALAAIKATISESFSWSCDNTVQVTWVSFLKSLWNNGLIGLSISLQINVSFSVGLASLLKKPPGIFPTE